MLYGYFSCADAFAKQKGRKEIDNYFYTDNTEFIFVIYCITGNSIPYGKMIYLL